MEVRAGRLHRAGTLFHEGAQMHAQILPDEMPDLADFAGPRAGGSPADLSQPSSARKETTLVARRFS